MTRVRATLCAAAIGLFASCGIETATAQSYEVKLLVPGSAFHGVHGIRVGPNGHLFAGSVAGAALYEIDPASGKATIAVPSPQGMADDLAFGPDGTMAWTAFLTGDIYARKGDGPIRKLASGLPGINSIAFREDGRLYATQVFLGDALYEIDPQGEKPARKIMEKMGGLNGFKFGADDKLYGPLWFKGQVVRVDVDTATLSVVADGLKTPAAVDIDAQGNLYVVDTATGELIKIDPASGQKTVAAKLKTSLDNLAVAPGGSIFVTNMADNGIQEVDPKTGAARQVIIGKLSLPGGIALVSDGDTETIYVADVFAYRAVDAYTGEVRDIARMHAATDTLEYPMSASANPKHVVLSSWFTGTVQIIDRQSGKSIAMLHDFKAPHDAVELADGSLLVLELGTGSLVKVSGEHGKDRQIVAKDLGGPVGLVVAPGNVAYITESTTGQVVRVDLARGNKTVVAKDLKLPEGIALTPTGTLIVAEVGAKRLIEIDPANGKVVEVAGNLPIGLAAPPGMLPSNIPTGVAVSPSGAIYFSSDIENAIYKLTAK